MAHVDALIAENAPDFVDALQAADNEPFEIQLRRNTQVELHVERVVIRHERTRRCTARNRRHHGRLHFEEASLVEVAADRLDDLRARDERVLDLWIHDEIDVALTVAHFHILQTVKLFGKRAQRLREKREIVDAHRELAAPRAKDDASDADDVTDVQELELLVLLLAQNVELEVDLNLARKIHEHGEARLAMAADRHQTPCDADLRLALRLLAE